MFSKKFRQLTSIILLSSVAAMVSCGDKGNSTSDDSSSRVSDTEPIVKDALEERAEIADGLPVKDYKGDSFTIAAETQNEWMILQAEETGDVISDAVYKRNMAVEERFNVKLAVLADSQDNLNSRITNSIQANDDDIDLCFTHVVSTGLMAMNDVFMNWYDIPYIDFSKPWWSQSNVDDLTVDGVCPLAIGDFALNALAKTYCVFYNLKLGEDYGLDDIYGVVNDGKWTIDYVQSITKDIYSDLNYNNAVDGEDLFGYISTARSSLNTYLWAFGGNVLSKNSSGEVELVYHTDRTNDMVNKLCSFFFDNAGIYINSKEAEYSSLFALDRFAAESAVFINASIGDSVDFLREMKSDYGILPYPKWDEAQDRYYTMVDGSHGILAVPITVRDTERVGIITEALCAESYKKLIPAYYETALKTKYTRDDESVEMLDKIVESRVFDLGYVYDGWKGASFIFQTLIAGNKPIFESHWASKEAAISAYYDTVIGYFESYDDNH
ncbi:MAG: hypothetical protein HFE63_06010 [Clostridiales bacterium]|nr:hypothetical protein [Clostridiales bacterium]